MEEVQETSTPWDPKTPLGLLPGRLGVNEEPSDESESDSEREPVNWRGRQTQRSWPKTEPAMVTPTDHVRAEQRWKWARMLRDTGLTFSGAKDKLGAETFLARLERYRTKGAIPQEDMLFAVDALLVGEAQVWYESVEHKLHSWQDFERRFRRSFANQATPEELLTELRAAYTRKGRFREPLPYENQVAIAFRGIRPEYRNFIAHREISSFKELEKAGKEYEKLCRMNAYWHEPVTHANQLHPRAAYKPVQARQCAAVEVSSPKAEGSSNKKSKKRKSPKKKPTSPPRTPPKEVAALEKTQAPQSNRYGERRTQWKNSNLQPSGGAIRKELRCTTANNKGIGRRIARRSSVSNATRRVTWREHALNQKIMWKERHSMSGLRPKRCNGAGVRPLQLLVRPFGKRAGGGAGSVAVPLKSHTRPKESERSCRRCAHPLVVPPGTAR
ncbi:unnamed protein product [Trichogramma brassicae]|uniref:Retrotransposon gag domain-containing protein n=1 Tax=Trichogramma brassicae TaxID=86971 RepID=A0A6H5ISF2_9HYME|nr:unnamed protein product [Trichogramma brassicae]